jgi:predicted ABC-type ATPase
LPVLTIIGGPNGAGKSTHSKELLEDHDITAFDFDKSFYSIWAQFSFDPAIEQAAFDGALDLYINQRTSALSKNQNFAFETNYHTEEILPVVNLFKSNGYKVELIFIFLESTSIAIERVKDRVAKGGHPVDEETIIQRFNNGLTLLNASFQVFDSVSLYLSEQNAVNAVALLEPDKSNAFAYSPIPSRLGNYLPNIINFMLKYNREENF